MSRGMSSDALAQGRDIEGDDVELEKQVLPEPLLGDQLLQVLA